MACLPRRFAADPGSAARCVRDFSLGQHPQYLGREAASQKRRIMGGTGPMKRSRPMGGSNRFGLDDDLDDICDPFDGFFGYGSD